MATECGTCMKPVYRVSLKKEQTCRGGFVALSTRSGSGTHVTAVIALSASGRKTPPVQGKKVMTRWFDLLPAESYDGHVLTENDWFPSNCVLKMSEKVSMTTTKSHILFGISICMCASFYRPPHRTCLVSTVASRGLDVSGLNCVDKTTVRFFRPRQIPRIFSNRLIKSVIRHLRELQEI